MMWLRRVEPVGTVKPNLARTREKPRRQPDVDCYNYGKHGALRSRLLGRKESKRQSQLRRGSGREGITDGTNSFDLRV
jgi:hypothetical protein